MRTPTIDDREPRSPWERVFWPLIRKAIDAAGNMGILAAKIGLKDQSILGRAIIDHNGTHTDKTFAALDKALSAPSGWTKLLHTLTHVSPIDQDAIRHHLEKLSVEVHVQSHALKADGLTPVTRQVPVIASTAAGDPKEFVNAYEVGDAAEWISCPTEIRDPNAFALKVEGNSMEPVLRNGDYVIVSPVAAIHKNNIVVFKTNDDRIACRLYEERGDQVILKPANPSHEMQILDKREIAWVYRVVQSSRRH